MEPKRTPFLQSSEFQSMDFREKKHITKKKQHTFSIQNNGFSKKKKATSNLAFSIQPKEKRAPPSQHTLEISPMEVGSSKALCLATVPELAPDLHMACDPCHDFFSCFRFSADGDFFVWFQKKLKVGLKERGLLVQSFFFIVACSCSSSAVGTINLRFLSAGHMKNMDLSKNLHMPMLSHFDFCWLTKSIFNVCLQVGSRKIFCGMS